MQSCCQATESQTIGGHTAQLATVHRAASAKPLSAACLLHLQTLAAASVLLRQQPELLAPTSTAALLCCRQALHRRSGAQM
jgi:hypothetical protein